ncbi:MAG: hypothetical protein HUU35_00275, partial [Armatimonadetes bacterium]|nr:hypothetical protein [Armatimonadota bacterium]
MLNRDRLPRLSPLLLAVLLLSPGWAAKPVLQVWREMKGASIRVVTPESPASAAWVQTLLGPLPTNVVGPSDYLGNSRLNGGEQVVVLYRRDQAASWPEPLLGRLARNPASLPVDEVLVATKQVGKGNWETTVIAPDEAQLREAFTQLLQTDSAAFSSQPSAMLSWKVVEGLGIGTGETHLRAWLSAQNSPRQRLKAKVCSPANPDPEALRNSPVSLVALTYTEWRDLGKPLQDILHGLLPAAAADALRNGEDRRLMTAAETKDGKLRLAVVAPSARFVEALLPLAAETDELRAMKYGSAVAGAQLTSLSSAGGACELKDLRGYRTAVITAAGLTNELGGPAAADFAYKLRRALAEQGGWQFIDDQALEASVRRQVQEGAFGAGGQVRTAGADALIIARLHHVEQRTDYAEGQAQQLTPRPVAFTEIEPAKPDPDARLWIIAGPKVYPNGINDPKYATDLATWDTNYRQWQQRRDAHAYQTQNAEVVWEQKLLVRQTVRIDGILEIYSRDGVLVTSLPIVGGNQLITTKPTRTTVRGYTSAPTALSLPSAENRVPDTMVTDAIGEAATRTAQSLTLTALTPRDGGARPTADIGTQPVQPVAE